ncbi:TetR family transcriptional regulator [Mycobacterium crocinum]|jgi:AcrR family transcriptional regulator|uniref:TetR family transcriptional regulator n=2 Tax=Mycolicibacterium TaxID=1866885 RepID=A0ABX8VL39_9MYCO|nr:MULTISPECIES: TetR family transcriptional regulator [Mycolicibacterium]APE16007.1 TetR family transcriptional regulator [Mycobacterium sp. WY10]MCV7218293.1 TetR family transcriptional regulator [Mycolicibacterium crocinum]QYL18523.1 TetR family transcriptional regulator [Mycolicibacterium pallens]ULN43444.1 TetR family transcriptional regulator [Mycolicibacterium crocinum]
MSESLRVRKRQRTRERIATAAARLVSANGLSATTVEQIADEADVARATFFRYFESKEYAVAEGFTSTWIAAITDALRRQPADLSVNDALSAAFAELTPGFSVVESSIAEVERQTRDSLSLRAWTLLCYLNFETAIAEAIAPRLTDLTVDDPRPRLIGALAMASVRISIDDWLRDGGSLSDRISRAVNSMAPCPIKE